MPPCLSRSCNPGGLHSPLTHLGAVVPLEHRPGRCMAERCLRAGGRSLPHEVWVLACAQLSWAWEPSRLVPRADLQNGTHGGNEDTHPFIRAATAAAGCGCLAPGPGRAGALLLQASVWLGGSLGCCDAHLQMVWALQGCPPPRGPQETRERRTRGAKWGGALAEQGTWTGQQEVASGPRLPVPRAQPGVRPSRAPPTPPGPARPGGRPLSLCFLREKTQVKHWL